MADMNDRACGSGDVQEREGGYEDPTLRVRLWLETEEGVFFGSGRAQLLERIEKYGSLQKAAEEMGMSYRAAWGKIKKTEKILGFKLISKNGSKRDGYHLTEYGLILKEKFTLWFEEVEKAALQKAMEIFPWKIKPFQGRKNAKNLAHSKIPIE